MLGLGTRIPTPSGWTTIADIQVGDEVFDESGRPCRVTATFDDVAQVAYRLHFSDGTTIDACGEHQWVTWTHAERKALLRSPYEAKGAFPEEWPAWRLKRKLGTDGSGKRSPVVHGDAPGPEIRTTQQIVDTLTYGSREDTNHCIPVCAPIRAPHAVLPIDPYVFGAWLGDGSSSSGDFTAHELDQPHLRSELERAGFRTTVRKDPQCVGTRGLTEALRRHGFLRNKHVPDAYLRASVDQRMALLQGLMDTDGSGGSGGRSSVEFSNSRKCLVDAVVELARSLGQKPVVTERRAMLRGRDCGACWRVIWTPTIPVFRMPRKLACGTFTEAQQLRNRHRMIVRAERIDPQPMRCLTVDSKHSMYLAGDGMIPTHNTRIMVEWIRREVEAGRARRIALVGSTASDVRDVLVEGESGILATAPPWNRPIWEASKTRLTWPNGAQAFTYSAEEPDRLRGKQHDAAACDELAAWRYPDTWDQLMFGLRLGADPRCVVATTPRPTPIIRGLVARAADPIDVRITRGSTLENRANLAPAFIHQIIQRYEGTRMGRQEIHGDVLDDNPGALWQRSRVDELRVVRHPDLTRVVVAVDPAVSNSATSDETGIVVVGLGVDRHLYVLADCSLKATPAAWATAAVTAFHKYRADRIIAEVNQGGAMVESTIRAVDARIPYRAVHASRGKVLRAEPIAALYERGLVHHVGTFPKLEDQMAEWDPASSGGSPDRVDALVYACTEFLSAPTAYRDLSALPPR